MVLARLFPAVIVAALSSSLLAQEGQVVMPHRTVENIPSSKVDTNTFFPQINLAPTVRGIRPENPKQSPDPDEPSTGLIAGELGNYLRGQQSAKFPTIGFTGSVPPDPDIAVGPDHVVVTVNTSIAFYDKSGTRLFQQTSNAFFAGLGAASFQFDPKAFYDTRNRRYVILFLELGSADSHNLIAVSDDADPRGTWFRYRIPNSLTVGGNTYWSDYPGFGYNKDAYVMSGNMFPFSQGGIAGVQFVLTPITPMLSGQNVTASYVRSENSFTAQIGQNAGTLPYVYATARSGSAAMRMFAINTEASNALTTAEVPVPNFRTPRTNAPTTNGNVVDSLDGRLYQASYRNGSMVTAHTIDNNGVLMNRWYQISTNGWPAGGTPSLVQSGNIAGGNTHYHMVAAQQNSLGDIATIFSASSTSLTADIMFAGRSANDPLGTMSIPQVLESSAGDDYSSFRWGDYFDVEVDPADDLTFWGIGMTVSAQDLWSTSVHKIEITPVGFDTFTIAPNPLNVGASGTARLRLTRTQPTATTVTLTSNPPGVLNIPSSIVIPAGEVDATFGVTTNAVADSVVVSVTADAGAVGRRVGQVRVLPVTVVQPLEIWGSRVAGGNDRTCILNLSGPAPRGGASVYITSSNESLVFPERSWVVVPEGQTSLRFRVRTRPVLNPTRVDLRVSRAGVTISNDMLLLPASVAALELAPTSVRGGGSVTGTVYLDAPAPSVGATVQVTSSLTSAARTPATVSIPAGQRSGTFTISTSTVTAATNVTIRATRLSSERTATLRVNP